MAVNKKISELVYISSGSIDSTSMIEVVHAGDNYRTTPKDFVQSAIPIDINAFPTGSAQVITTASNLGSGAGIYGQKVGNDLQFKSLVAGNNITLSSSSVGITINSTASGSSVPSTGSIFKKFKLDEAMVVEDLAVLKTNGNIRKIEYVWLGQEYTYHDTTITTNSCDVLSTTKFVVGCIDTATGYAICRIGEVGDSNVISYGPEFLINENSVTVIKICALSATSFIACYDTAVKVGTVSGTYISWGSPYPHVFSTNHFMATVLNATTFAIGDRKGASGSMAVGTIVGNVITYGSPDNYTSDNTNNLNGTDVTTLDENTVVVYDAYSFGGLARNYTIVGSISGSVISFGGKNTFANGPYAKALHIDTVDSTHVIILYTNSVDQDYPDGSFVRVGTVSGTSVSFPPGDTLVGEDCNNSNLDIKVLDSSTVVTIYTSANVTRRRIGTISGNTISFNDPLAIHSHPGYIGAAATPSIGNLTNGAFVVAFKDNADSYQGKVVLGAGTLGSLITDKILGIAQESGSIGQYISVATFSELSATHSGLTPSYLYYYNVVNKNGLISTNNKFLAGVAYSPTELKIVSY